MIDLLSIVGVGAVVFLLLCSAFFSSSETAIFSLSPDWVEEQTKDSHSEALVLKELYDDPHRLLVTLLVGNNIVNVAISSIVTVLIARFLPAGSTIAVTTLLTSFLLLVFGEIVPKSFGLANAERWSLVVSKPVRSIERLLSPLITLFDWITRRLNALISLEDAIEKPYLK